MTVILKERKQMSKADKGSVSKLQNRENRNPSGNLTASLSRRDTAGNPGNPRKLLCRERSRKEGASQERPLEIFRRSPLEALDK